jgi:hypothetical protein
VEGDPAHPPSGVGEQIDDERVLDDLDARVVLHPVQGRDERPGDLGLPVASPPAWAMRSRWWPPSRVSLISPPASRSNSLPELHQFTHPLGALGDERAHGVDVAQTDAGDEGVVQVLLRGVLGVEAAAMPPWAHCVEPAESTVLVTSSTRSTCSRSRSAHVSPAMPEPTTMTSALVVQPGAGAACR